MLGDRYRVLSRIGEGGMGTVYLCEHAVLQRRFAVKVLRADLAGDVELVDRFRNEAIAASRIGQENVVDVLDFGAEEDGALYYVMEALEGRSLGVVIHGEGPLPVPRALAILEQLCRALAAAHARGVVHRDVKPDNVFLVRRDDGTETVKVIDFGISHLPPSPGGERITRAGSIIGTPEYMAPEQAAGQPVDHRSDVYGLGVLAFEMLTGRLPIVGDDPIATLVAHRTQTPDPPSRLHAGIPVEIDALVLRALAKRPDDRFPSMDDFAAEVARIRATLIEAAPPGGAARSGKLPRPSLPRGETVALPATDPRLARGRRTRRVVAGLAAIAIAVMALLSMWWWEGAQVGQGGADPRQASPPASTAAAAPGPSPVERGTEPPGAVPAPLAVPSGAASPVPPQAVPAPEPAPKEAARGARGSGAPAGGLKDPYGRAGNLKPDPFR